jgi:glutathione S-transferase
MYKVIGSPRSRLTRVTWMLQELDEGYEIVVAKPQSAAILKYNPAGKGPVLADGDLNVIDSAAICIYLADKHADKGMSANPGTADRAMMDSWIHFAQSDLEAPLWMKAKHSFILPEDMRLDVRNITKFEFSKAVKAMEARLGNNQFALGDRFTAADVLLGHCGSWARNAKFEIESDTVNDYMDRVLGRDALARARELEKEL